MDASVVQIDGLRASSDIHKDGEGGWRCAFHLYVAIPSNGTREMSLSLFPMDQASVQSIFSLVNKGWRQ